MKKHNQDYSGLNASIEVVDNGFLLHLKSSSTYRIQPLVFKTINEVFEEISRGFGLLAIGEEIEITGSKDE